jgi:hypothetical protein
MNLQVATLVTQYGLSPPDFEALAEESDLLSVQDALLHDPDVLLEAADHLEEILRGPVAWLPAVAPFGDLWQLVRVGGSARKVALCPKCYPDVGR